MQTGNPLLGSQPPPLNVSAITDGGVSGPEEVAQRMDTEEDLHGSTDSSTYEDAKDGTMMANNDTVEEPTAGSLSQDLFESQEDPVAQISVTSRANLQTQV